MDLTAEQWGEVTDFFSSTLDSIKADVGLTPETLDPNAKEADRRAAAAMKVDQFFDQMLTGQTRLRLLPGMLAWTLRSRGEYGVNPAGISRAIELAREKLASEGGAGAAPPVIRPAPGGPPVGNAQP
jgi:hypothetical protein